MLASIQNFDWTSWGIKSFWFYSIVVLRIEKITQFTLKIWTSWYFVLCPLKISRLECYRSSPKKQTMCRWECRTAGPGFSGLPFYPLDGGSEFWYAITTVREASLHPKFWSALLREEGLLISGPYLFFHPPVCRMRKPGGHFGIAKIGLRCFWNAFWWNSENVFTGEDSVTALMWHSSQVFTSEDRAFYAIFDIGLKMYSTARIGLSCFWNAFWWNSENVFTGEDSVTTLMWYSSQVFTSEGGQDLYSLGVCVCN
jgi:hypothetical protein